MAIKVITPGKKPEPKYRLTCFTCQAVLEYTNKDLIQVGPNEDGIECPCCKHYNNHFPKNEVKA